MLLGLDPLGVWAKTWPLVISGHPSSSAIFVANNTCTALEQQCDALTSFYGVPYLRIVP
jgi:hypothetical protein